MSGPSRNPDKLNTIGIVVVGICGAVLVYVTIVALQAFYMNDTSEIQNTADYGGEDTSVKAMKADQMANVTTYGMNAGPDGTYHVPVETEFAKVIAAANGSDGMYVPRYGAATCRTTMPIPGRGHPDPTPGAIAGCPGVAVAPAAGSGSGAGSAAAGSGAGSAAPDAGSAAGSAAAGSSGVGSAAPGGHAP